MIVKISLLIIIILSKLKIVKKKILPKNALLFKKLFNGINRSVVFLFEIHNVFYCILRFVDHLDNI